MTPTEKFSEEYLNCYIDGELDTSDSKHLLQAMEQNASLRARVCKLQHLKDLVNSQFPLQQTLSEPPKRKWYDQHAIAMPAVMLFIGILSGWFGHYLGGTKNFIIYPDTSLKVANSTFSQASYDSNKVLLHIDNGDKNKLREIVDYAESLLKQNDKNGLQVELIANSGGIDLFRADLSQQKTRLNQLAHRYDNLKLLACVNAIARLKERGETVELIPAAHVGPTAIDHIVGRLRDGWTYQKI